CRYIRAAAIAEHFELW
nr:immunoglobulin heavy chain junction region [Macaca mulatta]MOV36109.1 immunoglobulin heavy chain junction region [Macaca mulatta]